MLEISFWTKKFPQIAHYTTFQGMKGILETNQLWATHYRFLNDTSELEHGKGYIEHFYQEAAASPEISQRGRDFFSQNPDEAKNLFRKTIAPNDNDPEFFISSFCGIPPAEDQLKTEDQLKLGESGLLSQWKGYGGMGGFAIVFDSKALLNSYLAASKKCKKHLSFNPAEGCEDCLTHFFAYLLGPVSYEHSIEILKKNELHPKFSEYIKKDIESVISLNDTPPYRSSGDIHHYMKTVIFYMLALKHSSFHEENEIRFACLNRLEKQPEHGGGFHNESPYKIQIENEAPRLKIDFLPYAVKKIIIGPQANQDKVKINIQYLLEKSRYGNVEIIPSKIPFIPR